MKKEFWIGKEIGKREEANARATSTWRVMSDIELYEQYDVYKSVDEDGHCRVVLDLDTFKELFAVAERQRFACDLVLSLTDAELKRTPRRIKEAVCFLAQDSETARMAWNIIRGEVRYDARRKKKG